MYSAEALEKNQDLEFERNSERFRFLKVNYLEITLTSIVIILEKATKVVNNCLYCCFKTFFKYEFTL